MIAALAGNRLIVGKVVGVTEEECTYTPYIGQLHGTWNHEEVNAQSKMLINKIVTSFNFTKSSRIPAY
jgi:hypothetical protein